MRCCVRMLLRDALLRTLLCEDVAARYAKRTLLCEEVAAARDGAADSVAAGC